MFLAYTRHLGYPHKNHRRKQQQQHQQQRVFKIPLVVISWVTLDFEKSRYDCVTSNDERCNVTTLIIFLFFRRYPIDFLGKRCISCCDTCIPFVMGYGKMATLETSIMINWAFLLFCVRF